VISVAASPAVTADVQLHAPVGDAVGELAGHRDLGGHLGQHEPAVLEPADRLAERAALLAVGDRVGQGLFGDGQVSPRPSCRYSFGIVLGAGPCQQLPLADKHVGAQGVVELLAANAGV
jgi:hypothetical protein